MIALDSLTIKVSAEPMKSKLTDAFMKAYIARELIINGSGRDGRKARLTSSR